MAFLCRITCGRLGPTLYSQHLRPNVLSITRPVTAVPNKQVAEDDLDERNIKLGRPMSPHLTIYAFQLTSVLSISHRFTGLAVTGYATAIGAGAVLLSSPLSHYVELLQAASINPALLFLGKLLIAYPFTFHFCNGLRHLIWDLGKSLSIKGVYGSGYLMLSASAISAFGLACI